MIDTCVIFAGGKGTRLGNITQLIPKPLVTIGDKPIIWHIMKHYSLYGVTKFIILAGYKHEIIKEYFYNYYVKNSDITIDLKNNYIDTHKSESEPWQISIINTGYDTMTSARLYKIKQYIKDSDFYLTYGDGLSDININKLTDFHYSNNKICTLTAVQPIPRFGIIDFSGNDIIKFEEKTNNNNWINGGFFVCSNKIFNYISNDETISFERGPLKQLSLNNQLCGYKHYGKWMCMDTERERDQLIEIYNSDNCFWL